jgi:hypothetical protein
MEQIKETLEEAAKKYSGIAYDRSDYEEMYYNQQGCDRYDAFINGAKWQAERMYSEEEIILSMKNSYGFKYFSEKKFLQNLEQLKKK